MPDTPGGTGSRCQYRVENLRCIFVDGHPGAHVCIGAHRSRVAVRGANGIPETTYLAHPSARQLTSVRGPPVVRAEGVWGEWTEPLIRRLLEEMYDAGVSPPRDWTTNFARLKSSTTRG